MIRYNKLLNFRALLSGFSALLLASCSSYQYAGYDDDGIYAPSKEGEAYTANDYEESYEDALYYKQLFAEKAETFENVPEEGAIFTDIEGYSSVGDYDDLAPVEEGLDYQTGRPAWGTDPDRISINIYEDRFYNPFYNPYIYPYYSGFYDPFLMPGFGYAYNPYGYGFGYPYGYGYYSPWRSYGRFGWNWGYRYGYPYSPYYYGGGHYYGNSRNYNIQDVAYSNSRRNSYSNLDGYYRNDDTRSESRIQRYSNTRKIRAARTDSDTRTYRTRSTRVRSSDGKTREAYTRSSDSRRPVYETRRVERRSTPTVRRSRTTQSAPVYRSSTPTRSSGTTRSSSSRSIRGRGN